MVFHENIVWGFCGWDLLAIIFLIAITALFLIRRHKLNKEIKELKEKSKP